MSKVNALISADRPVIRMMNTDTDSTTIRRIEFELEKAEHGMAMPYDAERVGQLRKLLVEARKRKLSKGETGAGAEMTTLTIRRKALAKQEEVPQIRLTKVQARLAAIVGRAFRRPASLPPCHGSIPARTA
jgi:hypothetical protein